MINHIVGAIFVEKNKNLVREHFSEYEHKKELEFEGLSEF